MATWFRPNSCRKGSLQEPRLQEERLLLMRGEGEFPVGIHGGGYRDARALVSWQPEFVGRLFFLFRETPRSVSPDWRRRLHAKRSVVRIHLIVTIGAPYPLLTTEQILVTMTSEAILRFLPALGFACESKAPHIQCPQRPGGSGLAPARFEEIHG